MTTNRLIPLPRVMVAPNGARRTKSDHPALPITVEETVAAAVAAHRAGAACLHAHVRDAAGAHVLDAGLYRELIDEMRVTAPDMSVQITTEAVGRYSPEEQRSVVESVRPEGVSVALREMCPGTDVDASAQRFHAWAADEGIAVQHILYSPEDVARYRMAVEQRRLATPHSLMLVLGRYTDGQRSNPAELAPMLAELEGMDEKPDWAVCAFGQREIDCLLHALSLGGKARIGFENNLLMADGSPARDNADRVRELTEAMAVANLT